MPDSLGGTMTDHSGAPPTGEPTLDEILRWLGGEAGYWQRNTDEKENFGRLRYYQTNVVSRRLMTWRDTGTEPNHGLD